MDSSWFAVVRPPSHATPDGSSAFQPSVPPTSPARRAVPPGPGPGARRPARWSARRGTRGRGRARDASAPGTGARRRAVVGRLLAECLDPGGGPLLLVGGEVLPHHAVPHHGRRPVLDADVLLEEVAGPLPSYVRRSGAGQLERTPQPLEPVALVGPDVRRQREPSLGRRRVHRVEVAPDRLDDAQVRPRRRGGCRARPVAGAPASGRRRTGSRRCRRSEPVGQQVQPARASRSRRAAPARAPPPAGAAAHPSTPSPARPRWSAAAGRATRAPPRGRGRAARRTRAPRAAACQWPPTLG